LKKIELPIRGLETLFGVHDQNIKYLESLLDVRINARGQDLSVDGDPADVETVEQILEDFSHLFNEGKTFTDKELREAFAQIAEDRAYSLRDYFTKARFSPAGKSRLRRNRLHRGATSRLFSRRTWFLASELPAPGKPILP